MQQPEDNDQGSLYPDLGFSDLFPFQLFSPVHGVESEIKLPVMAPVQDFSLDQYHNYGNNLYEIPFSQTLHNLGLVAGAYQTPLNFNCPITPNMSMGSDSLGNTCIKIDQPTSGRLSDETFSSLSNADLVSTVPSVENIAEDPMNKLFDFEKLISDYSSPTPPRKETPVDEQQNAKIPIKRLDIANSNCSSKATRKLSAGKTKTPQTEIEKKYRGSLVEGFEALKAELPSESSSEDEPPTKKKKSSTRYSKSAVMRRAKQFIQELKFKTSSLEKQNEKLREIILSLPGGAERLQAPTSVPSPPETSTDSSLNYSSPGTQLLAVSLLGIGGFHFSSSDSYENYSDDFSLYSLIIFFIFLGILCFTLYKIILAISRFFKDRPKASSTTNFISPVREVPAVFLVPCLIKESIGLVFTALYWKLSSPARPELVSSPGQIYHSTRDFIIALEGLKGTFPWVYTVTQCMRFMIQLLKMQPYSDKPLCGEIYSSLGLLLQTCFRRSFLAVKLSKFYFNKASTSSRSILLSQAEFFKWLRSEHAAAVCRPISCDSISGCLCDAFYLSKVEKLSIDYLSKPDSAPSLQDLFSEVNSNPLISEKSSCFAAILLLETCLAFLSGKSQYGIKFSFSLIQLLTKYPNMLSKKDSLALKGLFGCALSRPGPYQNVNASVSFLDISLIGSRDASSTPVLDFLTLHLIFTQRLALFISSQEQLCPESLTKALATLRLSLKTLRSHAAKYNPDQALSEIHDSLVELASFYTVASKKISLCGSLI